VFRYWLKDAPDSPRVSVTIFGKKHETIRTFSTRPSRHDDPDAKLECQSGMNTFVWDMLYPPSVRIQGMVLWTGGAGSPKAAPGKYTARFRYGRDSADVPFTILGDPNDSMSEGDYDAQVAFLLQVKDKYDEVQKAVLRIRDLRTQLRDLDGRLDSSGRPIRRVSDSLSRELTSIEESLDQTKAKSSEDVLNYPIRINDKLSGLYGVAAGGNAPPSQQVREVFAELSVQADRQLNRLKEVEHTGIPEVNKLIYERQVPVISAKNEPSSAATHEENGN
jgi:hypothetical protein